MTDDSPFLSDSEPPDEDLPTPWLFRITLLGVFVYLLWRLVQGVAWLAERL